MTLENITFIFQVVIVKKCQNCWWQLRLVSCWKRFCLESFWHLGFLTGMKVQFRCWQSKGPRYGAWGHLLNPPAQSLRSHVWSFSCRFENNFNCFFSAHDNRCCYYDHLIFLELTDIRTGYRYNWSFFCTARALRLWRDTVLKANIRRWSWNLVDQTDCWFKMQLQSSFIKFYSCTGTLFCL